MDSNSLTSAFFSRLGHIGKLHGKLHVKKWVNDLDWMVKLQEQLFWGVVYIFDLELPHLEKQITILAKTAFFLLENI